MEEQQIVETPVRKTRRRKKTKLEIIKEVYLPYVFLLAAAVIIVIFIIGALIRNANEQEAPAEEDKTLSVSECCDAAAL